MKPSSRIHELILLAVANMMEGEKTNRPGRADALLNDPRVILAAIQTYLDEEYEKGKELWPRKNQPIKV